MQVKRIANPQELHSLADSWNCLTRGVPFRSWQWLSTWWRHYEAADRELYVLAVYDAAGALVGVAPWFLEHRSARGRTLRLLGSGEVCTDYLTVLSTHEHEDMVTAALSAWLHAANSKHPDNTGNHWDVIELDGVSSNDTVLAKLIAELTESGGAVHRDQEVNCWQIELPSSWEAYVKRFSKSRRRKMRALETAIADQQFSLRHAGGEEDLEQAKEILIELHQARRRSLREPGCFASPAFCRFFEDVVPTLWSSGTLQISWLEHDDQPIAAEIYLMNATTSYMYQSGINPRARHLSPGYMISLMLIREAIEKSRRTFDFLRGDEPYKRSWGATPTPTLNIRVTASRMFPQIRHGVWLAGKTMKNWVKTGFSLTGMH